MYQGNSIVDYLNQSGQKSDFASRSQLAASQGIQGYTGTAQQNTQLLNNLKGGGGASTNTPQTQAPAAQKSITQTLTQPKPVQQTQQTQSGGWQSLPGYAGWDPVAAEADFKATGGVGKGAPSISGGAGSGIGSFFNTPTIDLPSLYEGLFNKSGIKDIENKLSTQSKGYNEAVAKIKDNPYLSEASMTGRLRKLEDKFNADSESLRGDIATRKADIETTLNLQLKQFDINSQQAQQALSQFTSLLSAGALDSASGEDIANITRATGLSSSIINSAIESQKVSGYQTSTQTFDDGTNEGFMVYTFDKYGNIVNSQQQITGKSSKAAAKTSYSSDPIVSSFLESFGLGGNSGTNAIDSELDALLASIGANQSSTQSVNTPAFSPAGGVGSVYTDPKSGVKFKYTANGWQKV